MRHQSTWSLNDRNVSYSYREEKKTHKNTNPSKSFWNLSRLAFFKNGWRLNSLWTPPDFFQNKGGKKNKGKNLKWICDKNNKCGEVERSPRRQEFKGVVQWEEEQKSICLSLCGERLRWHFLIYETAAEVRCTWLGGGGIHGIKSRTTTCACLVSSSVHEKENSYFTSMRYTPNDRQTMTLMSDLGVGGGNRTELYLLHRKEVLWMFSKKCWRYDRDMLDEWSRNTIWPAPILHRHQCFFCF